jgi:hypothetical protein
LIGAFGPGCGGTVVEGELSLWARTIMKSSGKRWLRAYIQLAPEYSVAEIDVNSILLHGNVPGSPGVSVDSGAPTRIGDHDGDGIPDLMVEFDYAAVAATLSPGTAAPVSMTGLVAGTPFQAETSVDVVNGPGMKRGDHGPLVTFGIRGVSPNPVRGAFRLGFGLDDGGPGKIEVIDVQGRRVVSREVGGLGPGEHALSLPGSLPAGVHVVRLSQGEKSQTVRTVVLQ